MAKIGQWQIFQLSIFILSREKCQHQSHWMRNFRVFLFVYWFFHLLEKFEPHCLSAIRIFQCFSRHNPRKVRQTTLYWESWRLCPSFINLTEWRQRRVTCHELIGYINTRKKIRYFFTRVLRLFSGPEIPVYHRSLFDKYHYHLTCEISVRVE